jgi:hypothetical protein
LGVIAITFWLLEVIGAGEGEEIRTELLNESNPNFLLDKVNA